MLFKLVLILSIQDTVNFQTKDYDAGFITQVIPLQEELTEQMCTRQLEAVMLNASPFDFDPFKKTSRDLNNNKYKTKYICIPQRMTGV
jgi:hypothetical protein